MQDYQAVGRAVGADGPDAPSQPQPDLRPHVLAGDIGEFFDLDLAQKLQSGQCCHQIGAAARRGSARR